MAPPSVLSSCSRGRAAAAPPRQGHIAPPPSRKHLSISRLFQTPGATKTPTTPTAPTAKPARALAPSSLSAAAAAAALSLVFALSPPSAWADTLPPPPPAATEQQQQQQQQQQAPSSSSYVADGARMLSPDDEARLTGRLARLDADRDWRVRVVTVDGLSARGGRESARAALGLPSYASSQRSFDRRTIVLQADPTAPTLLSVPYVGDDALKLLGRPFFVELESRYGNLFNVRDDGAPKALRDAVATLEGCLVRDPPCRVVPGLPDEQLGACLTFAVAGGIIAGGASKIDTGGKRGPKLQWLLLFAPLWLPLVGSFGVGPITSRLEPGEREAPLAKVLGAFAVSAVLPWAPELLGTRRTGRGGGEEDG